MAAETDRDRSIDRVCSRWSNPKRHSWVIWPRLLIRLRTAFSGAEDLQWTWPKTLRHWVSSVNQVALDETKESEKAAPRLSGLTGYHGPGMAVGGRCGGQWF